MGCGCACFIQKNDKFITPALDGLVINRLVKSYEALQETWDGDRSCIGVYGDDIKILTNNQVPIDACRGKHIVFMK